LAQEVARGLVGDNAESIHTFTIKTAQERVSLVKRKVCGLASVLANDGPAPLRKFAHQFTASRQNFIEITKSLIDERRESQTHGQKFTCCCQSILPGRRRKQAGASARAGARLFYF
jgi:hypothetical protein